MDKLREKNKMSSRRNVSPPQLLFFGSTIEFAGMAIIEITAVLAFFLALVFMIASMGFICGGTRDQVSRAKADMRSLATALESFRDEHGNYPAAVPVIVENGAGESPLLKSVWAPTQIDPGGLRRPGLTTPVAYILPPFYRDTFAKGSNAKDYASYAYYQDGGGWMLISVGPDGDYDVDPAKDYDSSLQVPSDSLISKTYDPSNGTKSDGDIWRVKD